MSIYCPVAKIVVNNCNSVTVTGGTPINPTNVTVPCAWYISVKVPVIKDTQGSPIEFETISGCAMAVMGKTLPYNAMYTVREILTNDE